MLSWHHKPNCIIDSVSCHYFLNTNFFQEIYREVELETQNERHKHFGMFVLVLMSYAVREDIILGCDGQPVDLFEIKRLLFARNFPLMKTKPKLLIIQACSYSE